MRNNRLMVKLRIFLMLCWAGVAGGTASNAAEQRHFSAEDSRVKKPAAIPEKVLVILRKDKMVQDALENENTPSESLPVSWFSASAIHLSTANRVDLVVVGQPPLSGANTATFWVFRATSHGYELVLNAPAHDLFVRNTRWKGYREIELSAETAVDISTVAFRFDGKRYIRYRARTEHIR